MEKKIFSEFHWKIIFNLTFFIESVLNFLMLKIVQSLFKMNNKVILVLSYFWIVCVYFPFPEYSPNAPLRALRTVPALFGSLLIPTVYYLVIELGFTHRTAMLAGLLVVLGIIFNLKLFL